MKKGSIFGIIVIAIAIAVIISTYTKTSSYGSFNDAKKTEAQLSIVGHLDKKKELIYDPTKDANYFSFYMTDKQKIVCFFFGVDYVPVPNRRTLNDRNKLF